MGNLLRSTARWWLNGAIFLCVLPLLFLGASLMMVGAVLLSLANVLVGLAK